jgi:cytochrome c peroxidase
MLRRATLALVVGVGLLGAANTPRVYQLPLLPGLIEPDIPRSNPLTIEKIRVGEQLFFDERLSRSGHTSCGTCHKPGAAFAEHRPVSVGDSSRPLKRNAPSVMNAGYLTTVMWDGQFQSLEDQALDPFRTNGDMSIDIAEVVERIASDDKYQSSFKRAFGGPPTVKRLGEAIASYERSLLTANSRFDEYLFLGRKNAINEQERFGYEVFLERGACVNCHDIFHPSVNPLGGGQALFTDGRFHNLGIGYSEGRMKDTGRFYWSRDKDDWGAFRTPSLRNVALTAPYMHDGSLATLEDVVDFYDRGGNPNPNLSPTIRALLLTPPEKDALVAFLKTLTDQRLNQQANTSRVANHTK